MHTPPIKAASWVVLYDRGPVRVPDLLETRQDHVIFVDLDRGCGHGMMGDSKGSNSLE